MARRRGGLFSFGDIMTTLNIMSFLFQNSNGKTYKVRLNLDAGTGEGVLLTTAAGNLRSDPSFVAGTALTVDGDELVAAQGKHPTYFAHMAIFNTDQSLNTLLNAA